MRCEELQAVLFALAERADLGGFDLVGVNPMLDVRTGVTSYLAAHTMVEFLGRICPSHDGRPERNDESPSGPTNSSLRSMRSKLTLDRGLEQSPIPRFDEEAGRCQPLSAPARST
jgi:hypothetical protein